MLRAFSLSHVLTLTVLGVFVTLPVLAADKSVAPAPVVIESPTKADTAKTAVPAKMEAPAAKVETPKAEAPKPVAEKIPDSYKAGNLEITQVSATEKGGVYEIYFTVKNNGKADDALTSAELVNGMGDVVTVNRVTTKEVTNQDAIKKAQEEVLKFQARPPVEQPMKDGEKESDKKEATAEAPKRPEIPKPEYKEVTKDVEGGMIPLPAEKTAKLESGAAYVKIKGYKKDAKDTGDTMSVMLHFRSSPNATIKVKAGAKPNSFFGKLLGQ